MLHNYGLDQRTIGIGQVIGLIETMKAEGISADEILAGTGITAAELENPEARVSCRSRIRQLENVVERVPPGFWLTWRTNEVSVSDYGLLGYAMMSSATLERAIQIAVKYHKTAGAMFDLRFLEEGGDGVIRLEHMLAGGTVGQLVVDDLFTSITPLVRLLTGREDFNPRVIHFTHSVPEYADKYLDVFDCPILFDQSFAEYRFDASLLSQPLAEADANAARACEESCRHLLNQMEIEEDLISRICHVLLSRPGEFPSLNAVADEMKLGTRTLRRRLQALGTSYQKVLDDVKRELAIEYLQTTNLSVQEISDLLDYSEVTNFRRAFLRWVGLSPYQYRKQKTTKS